MKRTAKRILCGALSLMMVTSLALEYGISNADASYAGATTTAKASFENVTGQFDTTKLMESYFNSSVMKSEDVAPTYETRTVVVTLKGENLVESADGENVTDYIDSWEGQRATDSIASEQSAFLRALTKKGIPYTLERTYNTVLNGVAIEIDTEYVSEIKKMSGVKSVVITTAYAEPETASATGSGAATNETNVYETGIYNPEGFSQYGEGTVVAVLDTGLDYTHPAFQRFETDREELTLAWSEDTIKKTLAEQELSAEMRSGSLEYSDVYVSDKVPFAYDYADDDADVYPSYSNHGTHVAGIIGGYDTNGYTDKDGNPIDKTFKGVVPDAQLAIFKVFTDDLDDPDLGGAVAEDIIAALDDCVKLGVDVINMSLGTSCGFSTTDDGDDEGDMLNAVYERIKDAGISLVCAASNDYSAGYGGVYGTNLASNPDSGTVGSPSTFAAALSVASVNGQKASYLIANENSNPSYVFYEESRDINGNPYDFCADMQARYNKTEFEYVVVGGIGQSADYTNIGQYFKDANGNSLGRIALIKRGDSTFQEKIEIAMNEGAIGVIVYNNVAGVIRMNLGEIDNPVPAVSINMNAGNAMVANAVNRIGTIKLSNEQKAGPFMSEFSSWGPTHDLRLKPEITAHGGEITSTVPGGYGEQSGTSMASPNMAGFTALVRSYIKNDLSATVDELVAYYTALERAKDPTAKEVAESVIINRLAMQMIMSTATTAIDQDDLAYSPRKQGAGLARIENVIGGTNAYLWTDVEENDYRPKLELFDNEEGVYNMTFKVTNFGGEALRFNTDQIVMTETLSIDKLTVSEQAHMLDKSTTVWKVDGNEVTSVNVDAGETVEISVSITLDESEKEYIETSFENGMYVEGFLKLKSTKNGQCDLSIPFLGFYGDWEAAPMLDYSAYEIAENEQDASVKEEDKIKASVFATQPYSSYYNEKYILPMGGYVYLLPDDADPVYVDEDKASVSRYNIYYGEGAAENYMTSTAIKAVYAGLLRNARLVKYKMYNELTGEVILEDVCYRVGKAYAGGGQPTPANVELEISPEAYDLAANGKYRMAFEFFMNTPEEGETAAEENTYEFSFTVDYEAPILEEARIRYYNYKDGNKEKQRIYLDVDVYDNHYAQALMVCYPKTDANGEVSLMLATDYPTPIRDANPNGTTTVSIEITDIYEKYGNQLYVQIDDYAVNTCLYRIDLGASNKNALPDANGFGLLTDGSLKNTDGKYTLELDQYEAYKVQLDYDGVGNASNFIWKAFGSNVAVKNGEIVGLSAGTATVRVSNHDTIPTYYDIEVTVTDRKYASLSKVPSISFGIIKTATESLVKATGTVEVHAGEEFVLPLETNPWYHPMGDDLRVVWSSTDEKVATVDQNGKVKTLKKGSAGIVAAIERLGSDGEWEETLYSTSVTLRVLNEFTVSNYTLTDYNGLGGVVVIPDNLNVWYIGAEAFKDNDNITKIVIPASVIQINERAFENCTALEEVYFVNEKHRVDGNGNIVQYDEAWNELSAGQTGQVIDWSDLSMIYEYAFYGCTNLKKIDFSNVKTATVAHYAFAGCNKLKEVVDMPSIGTMHHYAFYGCTSLREVDLTGLHMSGNYVFAGCTGLKTVKTGKFTAIGDYMFYGCTGLRNGITISTPKIGAHAFENCVNLAGVRLDSKGEDILFDIGAYAFRNCGSNLSNFIMDFNDEGIRSIGDRAFSGSMIQSLRGTSGFQDIETLGSNVFANTLINELYLNDDIDVEQIRFSGIPFDGVTLKLVSGCTKYVVENGILYNANKTKVLYVNPSVTGEVILPATVTEIGTYAFAASNVTKVTLSSNVTKIGASAFEGSSLSVIEFNGAALTEIPYGAFRDTKLASITLPATVTEIGAYAFAGSALNTFTATGVTHIGDSAFADCQALRGNLVDNKYVLTVPAATLGNNVFSGCTSLVNVEFGAVTALGSRTFVNAKNLSTVTFAAGTTSVGTYTFMNLNVTKVIIPDSVQTIGEGVFYGCRRLTEITLPNVKHVGAFAFQDCARLKTVNGIENVETFAMQAFYNSGIETLTLTSATTIGDFAFGSQEDGMQYTFVSMPNVRSIGRFAFFNSKAEEINLPATVEEISYGAFAQSQNLTAITVDSENEKFFHENGVLYRIIDEGAYELVAYPSVLQQTGVYEIKTGTVRIVAYAFYGLKTEDARGNAVTMIEEIKFPYTLNTIGDSAFFASGIETYAFDSIQAPVLETVYRAEVQEIIEQISDSRNESTYYKGYYNTNFETNVYHFSKFGAATSELTLKYPENGKGYDNHIYTVYFGHRETMGFLPEDETRACIDILEALPTAAEIETWLTWEKTDENKALVTAMAEKVKTARLYYNNASTKEDQSAFFTADMVQKLTSVEETLRSVKKAFGVTVKLADLRVAVDSAHKSEYVAGEKFDMTGLKIELIYDDYSVELAEFSKLKLKTTNGLSSLSRFVIVLYEDKEVRVAVTVTNGESVDDTEDNAEQETDTEWLIIVACAAGVAVVAVAVVLLVKGVKKSSKKSKGTVAICSDLTLEKAQVNESLRTITVERKNGARNASVMITDKKDGGAAVSGDALGVATILLDGALRFEEEKKSEE